MTEQNTQRNVFGGNTRIIGDIVSEGDFRIDGTLEGSIITKGKIIIGKKGLVKGSIECGNADIEGRFSGKLKVHDLLSLKSTAVLEGEVLLGRLSVEPGATFNATCSMVKAGSKVLIKNDEKKQGKPAQKTV